MFICVVAVIAWPKYRRLVNTYPRGAIVRVQEGEHRGRPAVVAQDPTRDDSLEVRILPCWQDEPEESAFPRENLARALEWGLPQSMPSTTWGIEEVKQECRVLDPRGGA